MEIAEDIADRSGRVLFACGHALTDGDIETLKTWGIGSAAIEGAPSDVTVSESDLPAEEVERITSRFSHVDLEHPVAARLLNIAFERACTKSST